MRKISALAFILSAALILTACSRALPRTATSAASPVITAVESATPTPLNTKLKANYELISEKDGQTALDLISSQEKIETKDYGSAGKFVTSINDLAGNNEYYWAFYLNGKYAEKGASQTTLKKGDTIKFVYEAVTATK